MTSVPPEDGSILPTGWTWSDVGHGALDVVGLVPILGEAADLTNAAWYAAEGNYLDAGLSAISTVPIVGDIIGKGGKIAKKAGGKLAGPALDALKKIDFKKTLEPLRKHPKIGPHVDKMAEALEKWRKELVGEAPPCTPGGTQVCPLVKAHAANKLKDFTVKGADGTILRPKRIQPGTNGKVAVIGRSMGGNGKVMGVRDYAKELRKAGHDVELFDGDMIPASAKAEMDLLTNGGRWLANPEVVKTEMYAANKAWAQKLKDEGYTVLDLGDFGNRGFSPYYSIEKSVIFGGK